MPLKIQLLQQFFFLFFLVVLFKYIIQLINDNDRITRRLGLDALPSSRWYTLYCLSPCRYISISFCLYFILIPSPFHLLLFLLFVFYFISTSFLHYSFFILIFFFLLCVFFMSITISHFHPISFSSFRLTCIFVSVTFFCSYFLSISTNLPFFYVFSSYYYYLVSVMSLSGTIP